MIGTHKLSPQDIERVEVILRKACGFQLLAGLRGTLQLSFNRAAHTLAMQPLPFLEALLRGNSTCISALIENSVIGETYFSRYPKHFLALQSTILPELRLVDSLKIWSAGCSSGEEAYGIAITLDAAGRAPGRDRIVGTDISTGALAKARAAVYTRWSLRSNDPTVKSWGDQTPEGFELKPGLRSRVEFRQANLIVDPAPFTGCHVIFCRNVLIYFEPKTTAAVLARLSASLAEGGYLILGVAELPHAPEMGLEPIEAHGVTLLRRPFAGSAVAAGSASAPTVPRRPAAPPSTSVPRPSTSMPRPSTSVPRPSPSVPRPSPSVPRPSPSVPRPSPSNSQASTLFERARDAARAGTLDEAEALAREAASRDLRPEAYLLLSMAAESRGDLDAAVTAVRQALYLDPGLAMGHATLVTLYQQLGKPEEAERARRNALHALKNMEDTDLVAGVEAITAAALREALEENISGQR